MHIQKQFYFLSSNLLGRVTAAAAAKLLQSCPTLRPHRRQPTRLPRPWDSPGKNTGVGCHFLLQCMKVKSKSESLSRFRLLATPWALHTYSNYRASVYNFFWSCITLLWNINTDKLFDLWKETCFFLNKQKASAEKSDDKSMGLRGFPGGSVVKNPFTNAGDMGSIPSLGRSHLPWSS